MLGGDKVPFTAQPSEPLALLSNKDMASSRHSSPGSHWLRVERDAERIHGKFLMMGVGVG